MLRFQYILAMGGVWDHGALVLIRTQTGADYIHPMPAGAKIVGELLYGALRDGYNEYKLRQLRKDQ